MVAILKAVFVIIGTIIGAGFASGQEIWLFFNKYGNWGIAGVILACCLLGFLIYKVFGILQTNNISTYKELLKKISNKKVLGQIISIVISLFLLISFYIMVAGMSAYFNQEFGFPTWVCSIVMSFLCYITLKKNMRGVVIVNTILIPCLILFITYLGLKNLGFSINFFKEEQLTNNFSTNWLFSSILYASYNSIVLIPMLIELKEYINTKTKAKVVSILCITILITLGLCLFCLLLRNTTACLYELPMIEVVKEFGVIYSYIYGGVVAVAIFTSAISAGYGFLKNEVAKKEFTRGDVSKREKAYYEKLLLVITVIAPIVAGFGFSNLVSLLYPIFGVLGLLQIVFLLYVKK